MNKTLTIGLLSALSLAGCVHQPEMIYVNAHPAAHNFDKDRFDCLQASAQAAPPVITHEIDALGYYHERDINESRSDQLMLACMKAREWTLTPVTIVVQQ